MKTTDHDSPDFSRESQFLQLRRRTEVDNITTAAEAHSSCHPARTVNTSYWRLIPVLFQLTVTITVTKLTNREVLITKMISRPAIRSGHSKYSAADNVSSNDFLCPSSKNPWQRQYVFRLSVRPSSICPHLFCRTWYLPYLVEGFQ